MPYGKKYGKSCAPCGKYGNVNYKNDVIEGPIFNLIDNRFFDDHCCDLVKRAFTFFTTKSAYITETALADLARLVKCGVIGQREYRIRYGIYRIGAQEINRLVVCALKRVLCSNKNIDNKCADFLGRDFGCFDDDYCETAVASVISVGLTHLCLLQNVNQQKYLDRNTVECSIRIILERLTDALEISTSAIDCCDHKERYDGGKKCCPDWSDNCDKKKYDGPGCGCKKNDH